MKARSKIFFKAILCVLMATLTLVICFPVVAATNSTTLTTTVPKTFLLQLDLTGNGTVAVNGVAYTRSEKIEIPRNATIELQITPDAGSVIKSVIYNGCDYTKEAKNGKLVLPVIAGEVMLCVSFTTIVSSPQTGDNCSPLYLTLLMLCSLVGITATLSFGKKKAF